MNSRTFCHVFSRVVGALVPVSEHAKSGRGRRRRRLQLAGAIMLSAAGAADSADPVIPVDALPIPELAGANIAVSGAAAAVVNDATRTLTVDQSTLRAIINWQSFNVGRDATVQFNHQLGAASATLNLIGGNDPSVIQGTVRALGELYMVNPNGVVFLDGARVEAGSLTVSALRMQEDAFNRGLLSLPTGANAQPAFLWNGTRVQYEATEVRLEAGSQLSASTGGRVMIFAPTIRNSGTISAPQGQVLLGAGARVFLSAPTDPSLRGFLVELDPYQERTPSGEVIPESVVGGQVENLGTVLAARGNATLAGFAINQSGRVSATTSVTLNGSVFLQARDSVSTRTGVNAVTVDGVPNVVRGTRTGSVTFGPGSTTEVRPELSDRTTTQDAQGFTPSRIDVVGRTITLAGATATAPGSLLAVPGGIVNLIAQSDDLFQEPGDAPVPGTRLFVGAGARIDVSGTEGVVLPVERNFIEVELRGNELRDSPIIRNGPLRGQTITVDIRRGTTLGDISGYLAQIGRGIGERTAVGGSISMRSEGDVVVLQGSTLDVSGAAIEYTPGSGAESLLRGIDGRIYPVSTAPRDLQYTGFADRVDVRFTIPNQPPGAPAQTISYFPAQRLSSLISAQSGYIEGRSAGSVDVVAHQTVLEGNMVGHVVAGPFQRTIDTAPRGGRLRLGDLSEAAFAATDGKLRALSIGSVTERLPTSFGAADALPAGWLDQTRLDAASLFGRDGFARLVANANGAITTTAPVTLAPFGTLELTGRSIRVEQDVSAVGGRISLATRAVSGEPVTDRGLYLLDISDGVRLDTSGRWTNDALSPGAQTAPIVTAGGSVSLRSVGDLRLGSGSMVDVSAGAYQPAQGTLRTGVAGAIELSSGRIGLGDSVRQQSTLLLGGQLQGFGFGSGGSLSLSTSRVEIGSPVVPAGTLGLDSGFFQSGGFSRFSVNGQDGLRIADGTRLDVAPFTWLANATIVQQPSGVRMGDLVSAVVLPADLRAASFLTLRSASPVFGQVELGAGTDIAVAPEGAIVLDAGRSVTVGGSLTARGGEIRIGNALPSGTDAYEGDVSVWVASGARLDVTGALRRTADPRPLTFGRVTDGGRISLAANKGYLVLEDGATLDASGSVASIDVLRTVPGGLTIYESRPIASAGGTVSLSAREGLLSQGTLLARPGGTGVGGGTLSVSIGGEPLALFPGGPRRIEISPSGALVPAGLEPGAEIESAARAAQPDALNGRAQLSAGAVTTGGFDTVSLRARDVISFSGDVAIAVPRALTLDAPLIEAGSMASVDLSASVVTLGHSDITRQVEALPSAGDGTLRVTANLVDLVGRTTIGGFETVTLASRGDIRLQGVVVDVNPDREVTTYRLVGALTVLADTLTLEAAQVTPTTLSEFTIRSFSHSRTEGSASVSGAGSVVFRALNEPASAPMSAAGILTVEAREIVQDGRLSAPFGEIRLRASDETRTAGGLTEVSRPGRVTLTERSVTSVSGRGIETVFGRTELSGKDYVYALGGTFGNRVFAALPEKAVTLSATDLALSGRIDVSGGGHLLAYEFVPGPGGSRDIFSATSFPNTFAIMPGAVGAGFGPSDHQALLGVTGLRVGDQVVLAGASALGLPAGAYTLLPPGYAVLDGAYLVSPVSGSVDITPGTVVAQPGGGVVVAGQRSAQNFDGTRVTEARTSGFLVESAAAYRPRAEFTVTRAGGFFADANAGGVLGDAGRVSLVSNGGAFAFSAQLVGEAEAGRRGKSVDIARGDIRVIADGAAEVDGALNIPVSVLNAFRASTLVLGGTRQTVDGRVVLTAAGNAGSRVVLASGVDLVAGDAILVSPGAVVIEDGARVSTSGIAGSGEILAAGNGAIVRVSQSTAASVVRSGFDGSVGDVVIGAARLEAPGGAVVLDATRDTVVASDAVLEARAIQLAAGTVSAGQVPEGTAGLVLDDGLLAQVGRIERLVVRSYGTLDLHGDASIGALDGEGSPRLTLLEIDAPSIRGFGTGDKTLRAGSVSLSSTGGGASAGSGTGTGRLLVNALAGPSAQSGRLLLGPGAVRLTGFSEATLTAGREVRSAGSGSMDFVADSVHVVTPRWLADDGAVGSIQTTGALAIGAPGAATSAATAAPGLGASVSLTGASVTLDSRVDLPSGNLTLIATGSAPGDGVTLGSQAVVNAAGRSVLFTEGVAKASSGGTVRLLAETGTIHLASGSVIDVSSGGAGAAAGLVQIRSGGSITLDGALSGAAGAGTVGGRLDLDSGVAPDVGRLASVALSGGFDDVLRVRARTGDVVLAAGETLTARELYLAADAGRIRIGGLLDAHGPTGGRVDLWAGSDVVVDSGGRVAANATAAGADGGDVFLGTTGGTLTVAAGSVLDVRSGSAGSPGEIWLRAPRVGTDDVAVSDLSGEVLGADHVSIEAFRVYTGTTIGTTTASAVRIGDSGATATVFTQTRDYLLAARPVVASRLGAALDVGIQLRPGIEIVSDSTLALNSDWNFYCGTAASCSRETALWNFDGAPGVLTLRAADSVALTRSLNDGFRQLPPATLNANTPPQAINDAFVPRSGGGWSYRIIAGADAAAADPGAVRSGVEADVVVSANRLVRTSTGFIDIAASRDVVLSGSRSAVYTAGEPGAAVGGFVTPNVPTASGLPRAHTPTFTDGGGDVRALAGRDVRAEGTVQSTSDWLYRDARRSGSTILENPQTAWWVRYDGFLQGFGTLGGGDVRIGAARDLSNVTAVAPTNGRLGGATGRAPGASDFLELAGGDVSLDAGRDVLGGLVLVQRGEGLVRAGRDVGSATPIDDQPPYPLIGIGDAVVRVQASGNVTLDGVFNSTIQRQARGNIGTNGLATTYFLTYADRSAIDVSSITGDITLSNNTGLLPSLPNSPLSFFGSSDEAIAGAIYPPTLRAVALNGSVSIDRAMYLAPAARGQLELLAATDVRAAGTISMSDVSPLSLPGVLSRHGVADGEAAVVLRPERVFREPSGSSRSVGILIVDAAEGALFHDEKLLHRGDDEPVRIVARDGDVTGVPEATGTIPLFGVFPKKTMIVAGRDVRDAWIIGQNLGRTDITRIEAGRDVIYSPLRNASGEQLSNSARLEWGGPGEVQITAGRSVDLGNSLGLITKGNFNNPFLPEEGSALRLATGSIAASYDDFLDLYLSDDLDTLVSHFAYDARQFLLSQTGVRVDSRDAALSSLRALPEARAAEFANSVNYRTELAAYMRERTGDAAMTESAAVEAFRALERPAQTAFVNQVLFSEIRASAAPPVAGQVQLPGAQIRGYRALAALYPVSDEAMASFEAASLTDLVAAIGKDSVKPVLAALGRGEMPGGVSPDALALAGAFFEFQQRYAGDVNLFFSQIKTEQGGAIEMRVPGGLVNAGLANPGTLAKPASDLGIVTVRGGDVRAAVLGDFQVNQSRVFTLGGGDIGLFSAYGNIDAGKGAKTASATPPPQIVIRDGKFVLDTSRSVEGSGIGVLLSREGVEPGNVDLIAPLGLVDAGDAGIRSAGNLNIVANLVLNALNIDVGGTQTGPQSVVTPTVSASAGTNADAQASSAVARAAEASAQSAVAKPPTRLPSFITVEVVGYGDSELRR